jgi:hypothetical protein
MCAADYDLFLSCTEPLLLLLLLLRLLLLLLVLLLLQVSGGGHPELCWHHTGHLPRPLVPGQGGNTHPGL